MKKSFFIFIIVLIMSGCSTGKKEKTITVYIPPNAEEWAMNNATNTVITNERIDKVNEILKKDGKNYHVEIKIKPGNVANDNNVLDEQIALKQMGDEKVDISYFDTNAPLYNEYLPLNKYFKTEIGKELRTHIPDYIYQNTLIKDEMYYVPNVQYALSQSNLYVRTDCYNKFKNEIEERTNDLVDVISFISDNYPLEDNQTLIRGMVTGNTTSDYAALPNYTKVKGTPFYIQKETHKIVNLYEEDSFLKYYQLAANIECKNQTTSRFTREERNAYDEINGAVLKFVMMSNEGVDNEDISEYTLLHESDMNFNLTNGFGILKSSEHPDEAFDFLYELNVNQEISNVFTYGVNYEINEDGKVITNDQRNPNQGSGYYGVLGVKNIASPMVGEVENTMNENVENIKSYLQIFDISNFVSEINDINNLYNTTMFSSVETSQNDEEMCMLAYNTKVENDIKRMNMNDIHIVMTELQKQLDENMK